MSIFVFNRDHERAVLSQSVHRLAAGACASDRDHLSTVSYAETGISFDLASLCSSHHGAA